MSGMSPLRRRDFVLLLAAIALSSLGDLLAIVALTIRVHDLTHSGLAVSALLLADVLAHVLFAPAAGLLVDRIETVKVLALTALLQAAVATGLAFAHAVPLIVGLSFVLGAGGAVATPAVLALVPRAVGEERMTEANAYLELARYGGAAGGPVLAGVLAASLGTAVALLADAASFLVLAASALALTVRRPPEIEAAERAPGARRKEARQGFSFLLRDRLLGLAAVVLTVTVVFAVMDNVALVFFAKDVLGVGDGGYGTLLTGWTIGMVAGALLIARRLPASALALSLLLANAAIGAAVTVSAAAAVYPLVLGLFVVAGAGNGIVNVTMRSLVHHRAPDRIRGRVFAANTALLGTGQIAAATLGGTLVQAIGSRGTLLLAGAGTIVVGVAGLVFYARLPARARAVRASATGDRGAAEIGELPPPYSTPVE
jgi:MFS family permease